MLLVNALHEKGSAVREVWPNRFVDEAISPRHVFACVKAWRRVGSPALYQGGGGYRLFETLRVVKATGTRQLAVHLLQDGARENAQY
jgi:hypothetical protein